MATSSRDFGRLDQPAYGPYHERLVALKNKYDPTNMFRLNANIIPSGVEV